jgi:hypothetical protein
MNEIICGICQQHVHLSKGGFLDYENCNHYTHINCNSVDDKDLECPTCNPDAKSTKNMKELVEPDWNGDDWVTHPITSSSTSINFKHYWTASKDIFKKSDKDIENPLTLLSKKTPIEWMIRNKQWGLPHMHFQGIKLVDFIKNNYTIEDLCKYKDIGKKGQERSLDSLRVLGLTPDMLITYKTQLPIKILKEKCNLIGSNIISKKTGGGLWFNGDVLSSVNKQDWTLDDILYLGLSFNDLQHCGLDLKSQWNELEDGHKVTSNELKLLNCKQKDIDELLCNIENDVSFEEDEELPKTAPPVARTTTKTTNVNLITTVPVRKILKDNKQKN